MINCTSARIAAAASAAKDSGAAQQQPCRSGPGGVEGGADGGHRLPLRLRIQSSGVAGAGDEQGARWAFSRGGEPGAVARLQMGIGQPALGQAEKGAGRVGEAEAGQQRRGGGAQPVEQGLQPRPQGIRGEGRRPGLGREQVAVAEQQRLLGLPKPGRAIADEIETAGGAQPRRGFPREPRQLGLVGALDAGEQQGGGCAAAQFAEQEGAGRGAAGRQEFRQVGPHPEGRPQRAAERGEQQQCSEQPPHGAGAICMRVTPPPPSVSIASTCAPRPLTVMRCTAARMRSESGVSTIRQGRSPCAASKPMS